MLLLLLGCAFGLSNYKNADYGFGFQIPDNWEIRVPDHLGVSVISLTNKAIRGEIAVGHHLYERTTEIHHVAGNHTAEDDHHHVHREHLVIDGAKAFLLEGVSTHGPFAMVHFHQETLVWFVWCNSNSKESSPVYSAFRSIIASWKFAAHAPRTLSHPRVHRAIHGDALEPMNANVQLQIYDSWCCGKSGYYCNGNYLYKCGSGCDRVSKTPCANGCVVAPPGVADYCKPSGGGGGFSGFGSPNPDWIWCGSSYHTGSACYAADVQGSRGDPIIAIYDGKIISSGWDSTGYGNLVMVQHANNYVSAYAHLDYINAASGSISKGGSIGGMGNSGTQAIHLHFHVRDTSRNAVQIKGMPTFIDNGWPSGCTSNGGANCARFA